MGDSSTAQVDSELHVLIGPEVAAALFDAGLSLSGCLTERFPLRERMAPGPQGTKSVELILVGTAAVISAATPAIVAMIRDLGRSRGKAVKATRRRRWTSPDGTQAEEWETYEETPALDVPTRTSQKVDAFGINITFESDTSR